MSVALRAKGPVWSTDACAPLIALYRAVQGGWSTATELNRGAYDHARQLPDSNPLKAFCGFGCSFSGKWFGGFAAPYPTNRTPHGAALRSLRRDVPGGEYALVDFLAIRPRPIEAILYLDPPYAGATGYGATPGFDAVAFVRAVGAWAERTPVFVSEYDFPLGEVVWESRQRVTVGGRAHHKTAVERLYFVGPS